jgi:hypothetical protein
MYLDGRADRFDPSVLRYQHRDRWDKIEISTEALLKEKAESDEHFKRTRPEHITSTSVKTH